MQAFILSVYVGTFRDTTAGCSADTMTVFKCISFSDNRNIRHLPSAICMMDMRKRENIAILRYLRVPLFVFRFSQLMSRISLVPFRFVNREKFLKRSIILWKICYNVFDGVFQRSVSFQFFNVLQNCSRWLDIRSA